MTAEKREDEKSMGYKDNPFTIGYGDIPEKYIERTMQENQIMDTFLSEKPSTKTYILTGIRGSGKTVTMAKVASVIEKLSGWTVIRLTTETDMLLDLEAELAKNPLIHELYEKPEFKLVLPVFEASRHNDAPTGVHIANIRSILKVMQKLQKRLLIVIDEAVNTSTMREFIQAYQTYVSERLPVFLLMTGLFENVDALQNEKNMTFLTRAPRIALQPLKIRNIADIYKEVFDINIAEATRMAEYTKGYPYAFQLLGYVKWLYPRESDEVILNRYDEMLEDYSYTKIWSDLSELDRKVFWAISQSSGGKVEEIREMIGMDSNKFTVYRNRLLKKGLVSSPSYGVLKLTIPRFDVFLKNNNMDDPFTLFF